MVFGEGESYMFGHGRADNNDQNEGNVMTSKKGRRSEIEGTVGTLDQERNLDLSPI